MTATDAPTTGATERQEPDRSGFDGAGWFLAIIFVALMYGLTVSALSGTASQATPPTVPESSVAMVLHGSP